MNSAQIERSQKAKVNPVVFKLASQLFGLLKAEGVIVCFLIIFTFAAVNYDMFFTARNIANLLLSASIIGIVALGMTMVILTRGIDLSVGSVFALSGVITAIYAPLGIVTAVTLGLISGLLCGLINGLIITRLKIEPFVATLAMLIGARGLCHLLTQSLIIPLDESVAGWFTSLGRGKIMGIPISGLIFVALAIIISIFLRSTILGRNIHAVGDNEAGARLAGIRINRVKLFVYTINGLLAAFAGIILSAKLGMGQPTAGDMYELEAILAVVLGGTLITGGVGRIRGTVIGIFILVMINNIFNLQGIIETWYRHIILGIILLAVVIFQKVLLIGKEP